MKSYRVGIAPQALEQIELIQSWWRHNRRASPRLFGNELRAAIDRLKAVPRSGRPFSHPRVEEEILRVLMPRTRYHVYYTVDEDAALVWILAVWHSSRGQGPLLK